MPTSPPTPCGDKRCPNLSKRRFCPKHEREYKARHPSARGVYNSRQWDELKAQVLREEPICAVSHCTELSTEADHILGVRQRPDLAFVRMNLQGMCKRHHSAKTARETFGRLSP